MSNTYNAESIEILEGLEGVRKRINVYLGDKGDGAVFVSFKELLDNACDEALAGYNNNVIVYINSNDQYVTVVDGGRGIPIDPHPQKPNKSTLEVVLTEIHAGGKFSKKYGGKSGGLNGLGLKAVCAISQYMTAQVLKNRKVYSLSLSNGLMTNNLSYEPSSSNDIFSYFGIYNSGTAITFSIDPSTLPDVTNDILVPSFEVAYNTINERSYLIPHCKFQLFYDDKHYTFHHPNGIMELIDNSIPNGDKKLSKPFTYSDRAKESDIQTEICLVYTDNYQFDYYAYCNCMRQASGGTHITGIKAGLGSVIKEIIKTNENIISNKDKQLELIPDDFVEGMILVVSIMHNEPTFHGQTKDRLTNADVHNVTNNIIKTHFKNWLNDNPAQVKIIINKVLSAARGRIAANKARDTSRVISKQITATVSGLSRVAECRSKNYEETELFIVEGDSAGGGAKKERDKMTQAVLPLRGKPKNSWDLGLDKILENDELRDLYYYAYDKDKEKPRYGKIIIASDADVDGKHISCLLLGFFFQNFKNLFYEGRIYLANPPLYKVVSGRQKIYLKEFSDLEKYLSSKCKDVSVSLISDEDSHTLSIVNNIIQNYTLLIKATLEKISVRSQIPIPDICVALQVYLLWGSQYVTSVVPLATCIKEYFEFLQYERITIESDYNTTDVSYVVNAIDRNNNFINMIVDNNLLNSITISFEETSQLAMSLNVDPNILRKIFLINSGCITSKSGYEAIDFYNFITKVEDHMRSNMVITRLKGLGEMNPEELAETVLNPKSRNLIQVNITDENSSLNIMNELLGKNPECRRKLIVERQLDLESLDF